MWIKGEFVGCNLWGITPRFILITSSFIQNDAELCDLATCLYGLSFNFFFFLTE